MAEVINNKIILSYLPKREQYSHKGTFGSVLNIAGSRGYIGAAYLSSLSALRSGCGYLTLACPESIVQSISSMAPEITFIPLKEDNYGCIDSDNLIENLNSYNVISFGCGLSKRNTTKDFILKTLMRIENNQKLVIDADGINLISTMKSEIDIRGSIITPHPKELSVLLNIELEEILENREKYATLTSQTFDCITVLKGHNTIITDGNKMFVNSTGNSALAKAGTGDVLTGMISAFLAQGVEPIKAAILGVYLHGLAGDIASSDLTEYSVLASDVIDYIPSAFDEIINEE